MATGVVQVDLERGREYFASLGAAMEALPVPVGVRGEVHALGIGRFDRVWIPAGREYVALADDERSVAWYVNRTYADRYVGPKQYARTEFSNFVGRAGGTYTREQWARRLYETAGQLTRDMGGARTSPDLPTRRAVSGRGVVRGVPRGECRRSQRGA